MTAKNTTASMWVDGEIYLAIAFFGAWEFIFASETAAKYISPQILFWLKAACYVIWNTFNAAKMFRSTSFARHQDALDTEDAKGQSGQTELVTQVTQPPAIVTQKIITQPPAVAPVPIPSTLPRGVDNPPLFTVPTVDPKP